SDVCSSDLPSCSQPPARKHSVSKNTIMPRFGAGRAAAAPLGQRARLESRASATERGGASRRDDDRRFGAVAVVAALDGAERARDAVAQESVIRIEGSPALAALTVRRPLREHLFVELLGQEQLARNDLVAAEKDLEVDVRRAPAVPARVDRAEVDRACGVGELRAAQEREPLDVRRRLARAGLPRITRVEAERVRMPKVDARTLERRAIAGANHLHSQR